MTTYTNEQVAHLVEGSLDWETTFRMLSMPKDNSRFEQYLKALQAKVSFKEKIVLPLGPHLYIVQNAKKQWVTQCDCGHAFGHPLRAHRRRRMRPHLLVVRAHEHVDHAVAEHRPHPRPEVELSGDEVPREDGEVVQSTPLTV